MSENTESVILRIIKDGKEMLVTVPGTRSVVGERNEQSEAAVLTHHETVPVSEEVSVVTQECQPGTSMSESLQTSPDSFESSIRYEWSDIETRRLIDLISERYERLKNARNKKRVWKEISDTLNKDKLSEPYVTIDKCIEKWKALKKGFRNHIRTPKKVGDPRKFAYADCMHRLMGQDLSVMSLVNVDGEGNNVTVENSSLTNHQQDEEDTLPSPAKQMKLMSEKKYQRQFITDLKRVLQERDERLMNFISTLHKENTALLNKLIDKL
ncbi:uncharacterized protein LOC143255881 [Tachypleus tridentatus]|uniref:uncharacterized protein LOC143255881 n=1 Tax=Tachypleus tridentatus TaxID=6853 RepID=UPI003FD39349